jgi:lysozyme
MDVPRTIGSAPGANAGTPGPQPETGPAGIPAPYVAQIQQTEGFQPKATWDYKQWTNGYGTRAAYPGEVIDPQTASMRFSGEIERAAAVVDRVNPRLDPGTRAALTSLTFNTGEDWVNGKLGQQIRAGDLEGAKESFLAYNHAGGQPLPGLSQRRAQEVSWFGNPNGPPGNDRVGGGLHPMAVPSDVSRPGGGYGATATAFAPEEHGGLSQGVASSQGNGAGPQGGGFGSPRFGNALMTAGLSLMASRSPYLGEAVGQAGLAGLGTYQEQGRYEAQQQQQEKHYNLEQSKVDAQVKRLDQMAENSRIAQERQTATLAETARHNAATEKLAAQKATVPPNFRLKDDGTLEPIPGSPADPAYKKSVADAQAAGKAAGTGEGDIDPVTLRRTAAQYNIMGPQALQNLGRGQQSGKNIMAIRAEAARMDEEAGITPDQRAQLQAQYQGQKAAQRTLGTQEARMGTAGFEAAGAIQLGRHAIEQVPRTSFLPLNRLIQGFQSQTLSPEQAELFTRTQGIINAYAAVMARGANVTTDASRHRAEELLNTASDPEVYNRVLDTMESEINMAINAPDKMREFYMKKYGAAAAEPAAPASPTGGGMAPARVPAPPSGVPADSKYSPSRNQWRAPNGTIYDAAGKALEAS